MIETTKNEGGDVWITLDSKQKVETNRTQWETNAELKDLEQSALTEATKSQL